MRRLGRLAGMVAAGALGCRGEALAPSGAVILAPATPTALTGEAGAPVEPAPTIVAKHDDGSPAAGVRVTFTATGGSTATPETTTDAQGMASVGQWVLGDTGTDTLAVAAAVAASRRVVFVAAAKPGSPKRLAFLVQPSLATAGQPIAPSIQVAVQDARGNRVTAATPIVTLTLSPTSNGAAPGGTLSVTAQNGIATFSSVTVSKAGSAYTLVASASGLRATTSAPFDVTAAGVPSIGAYQGNGQTATVGTAVATAPAVKVLGANGSAVAGVSVTFTPGTGSSVTGGAQVTGADGVARVGSWTLGTAVKSYTLTATANGSYSGNPVTLQATATTGPPSASQSKVAPSPTSFVAGQGSSTITVTVVDAYRNPVSGVAVTLLVSGSGNTITQPGPTGADGQTSGSFASNVPETKTVRATAGGVAITQTASVTVFPVAPPPVATVTVTPNPATVVQSATLQLTVTLKDAGGNVLTGRTVTWSSSNSAVATVNASGVVTGVAPGTASIVATSEGQSGSTALTVSYGFANLTGITYCSPGGRAVTLDLFLPSATAPRPVPLAIYIHGGGWVSGTSSDAPELPSYKVELRDNRKYAVASLNYRLGPTYKWPAQGQDVKCAVRFLRAKAALYGIDPSRMVTWGRSAGGQLAGFLGTADASAGFETSEYGSFSSRVQAVATLAGVFDLTRPSELPGVPEHDSVFIGWPTDSTSSYIRGTSPVTQVSPDDPPFLVVYPELDGVVAPAQSIRLDNALAANGVRHQLLEVLNADHGFKPVPPATSTNPTPSQIVTTVADFFDSVVRGTPAPAIASARVARAEGSTNIAPHPLDPGTAKRRFIEAR